MKKRFVYAALLIISISLLSFCDTKKPPCQATIKKEVLKKRVVAHPQGLSISPVNNFLEI